jgi:cytochrome c-type biogenesis protein CcmH/NrfG
MMSDLMTPLLTLCILSLMVSLCVVLSIFSPLMRVGNTPDARIAAFGMAGVMLTGAIAFYSYTGAWQNVDELNNAQAANRELRIALPQLAMQAQQQPKSFEARAAYGRALGKAGDHAKAAEEFRAAVLLSGGQPDLILDFATAQILSADGTISDEAIKSVDMVLLMEPKEPKARYYKAIYLQQHGDDAQARRMMNEILHDISKQDPLTAIIQHRLSTPHQNIKK